MRRSLKSLITVRFRVGPPGKHMKKQVTEMFTKGSAGSLATVHTGYFENGKELVLAAAYHKDGRYGYFITFEQKTDEGYVYTDHIEFHQKTNEKTYSAAAARLREIVEPKQ